MARDRMDFDPMYASRQGSEDEQQGAHPSIYKKSSARGKSIDPAHSRDIGPARLGKRVGCGRGQDLEVFQRPLSLLAV